MWFLVKQNIRIEKIPSYHSASVEKWSLSKQISRRYSANPLMDMALENQLE